MRLDGDRLDDPLSSSLLLRENNNELQLVSHNSRLWSIHAS
jgi:hypothetical protein